MRTFLTSMVAATVFVGFTVAEDKPAATTRVVLKSVDGKKTYDLAKLAADGPVLVRLTCACSGCDKELPFFQKLHAAYEGKGLRTVAVFKENAQDASDYVAKKDVHFLWIDDPKGDLWKTFDAKSMPTNILIDKGGKVVRVVPGCATDGKNAQALSKEIAKLLHVKEASIVQDKNARTR